MALTKYCDYEEIRAALGVNSIELADSVLALPIYEIGLLREMSKISSSLPAAFSLVYALVPPRTTQQQGLVDAVRMFAAYTVAKQAGVSLATFAPKDVGDGKATMSRFSGEPYVETMDNVKAALADARVALLDALAIYQGLSSSAVVVPVSFLASPRSVDPVAGS